MKHHLQGKILLEILNLLFPLSAIPIFMSGICYLLSAFATFREIFSQSMKPLYTASITNINKSWDTLVYPLRNTFQELLEKITRL